MKRRCSSGSSRDDMTVPLVMRFRVVAVVILALPVLYVICVLVVGRGRGDTMRPLRRFVSERGAACAFASFVDDALLPTEEQDWKRCGALSRVMAARATLVEEYRRSDGYEVGLFFKHVHKAAGVYFCNAWAKRNTPEALRPASYNCIPEDRNYCFVANPWEWDDAGLMSSEGPMPDVVPLLPAPSVIYVVVLRHPIDRTLSSFYYFLKVQDKRRKQRAEIDGKIPGECGNYYAQRNTTLAAFLESYPDNYMTRDLCGKSAMQVPRWAIGDFHRSCAQRRLDTVFSVVLVTEREETWEPLLRRELGWSDFPGDGDAARHERGDGGPTSAEHELKDLPNAAALMQTLRTMHAYDMQVYEHALQRMQQKSQ